MLREVEQARLQVEQAAHQAGLRDTLEAAGLQGHAELGQQHPPVECRSEAAELPRILRAIAASVVQSQVSAVISVVEFARQAAQAKPVDGAPFGTQAFDGLLADAAPAQLRQGRRIQQLFERPIVPPGDIDSFQGVGVEADRGEERAHDGGSGRHDEQDQADLMQVARHTVIECKSPAMCLCWKQRTYRAGVKNLTPES